MGASIMLAPFLSANAVNVVDSASTHQISQQAAVQASNAANAQLFQQLQALQEEVMRTRGMLEEQQHQIQELKQQRLDDYKNIDKRLSELTQDSSASTENTSGNSSANIDAPQAQVTPSVTSANSSTEQDVKDYQAAYELIKQRQFDQARDAFIVFIGKYPDSKYEANAHYWLGELYIIEGNFVKAKNSFQTILKNFPTHSKYPEALYKIATVNYELGDRTTAKLQMQQVIEQYGDKPVNAVAKARDFLQANFP